MCVSFGLTVNKISDRSNFWVPSEKINYISLNRFGRWSCSHLILFLTIKSSRLVKNKSFGRWMVSRFLALKSLFELPSIIFCTLYFILLVNLVPMDLTMLKNNPPQKKSVIFSSKFIFWIKSLLLFNYYVRSIRQSF